MTSANRQVLAMSIEGLLKKHQEELSLFIWDSWNTDKYTVLSTLEKCQVTMRALY